MEKELEKLVQNRKDLIEVHRRNDFTDGIHALLTDLYPDTAHFIYELLQNAEDMDATVVRFILDYTGIDFEHNGTKRNFNIADIDAITNIGHNGQKKNDYTSIGKFGVGFKAVFAYTSTPIIHSGNYHFRIENYFVPVFDNVPTVNTKDSEGNEWTRFSFPFNNPHKTVAIAYQECLDGLKLLDSTSILFLQHIKKIEYLLPDGSIGYVEREDNEANHVTIKYQTTNNNIISVSNWLRYSQEVEIKDEHQFYKRLTISIAYKLGVKNKKEIVVPINGKVFIYFPAEKEYSGLRFHINAPFASTVARDSVRNCPENITLIQKIAKLITRSFVDIKEQGLMNYTFFEVLPNNNDNLNHIYKCILTETINTFKANTCPRRRICKC